MNVCKHHTRNETGLAVVLGHEVANALADHGKERMSEALPYYEKTAK